MLNQQKKLGLSSVIATSVGLIVATGCLASLAAGVGPLGASFLVAMIVACLVNIFTALSLSELNALMPNLTGGLAQYSLASVGPFITIVTMVGGYLICMIIASCVETMMFSIVMAELLPFGLSSTTYGIILLTLLLIINYVGVDMFAKVQGVVAYSLIAILTVIGLVATLGIGTGETVAQELVVTWDSSVVLPMVGLAFYLFVGCEYVLPIAGEVKNAKRNIPLGMIISLVIILVMDTLLMFGMANYTSWADISSADSPHLVLGSAVLGNTGLIMMAVVTVLAAVSSVNSALNGLSHIMAGMGKIGLLPQVFMKKNKFGTPMYSLFIIVAIDIVLVIFAANSIDQLSFLILICCVFWIIAYLISNLNVIILRKKWPKAPRTFKIPGGLLVPVLGVLGNIGMVYYITGDPAERLYIYGICGIAFAIIAVYAVVWIKFVMKRPFFKAFEIKEVMAMENEMYHETRKASKEKAKLDAQA